VKVSEGSGKAVIVAVGLNSEWGKTMALMEDAGDEQTPLQDKLEVVAGMIGKIGFAVAIACFIALMIE
jgi:Ca2+-transporting ATPase